MKFQKLTLTSLLVLLLILIPTKCYAVVEPTERFYVNDYAEILSEETENFIFENSLNLYNQTGAQIVVLTVKNLDNISVEDYAHEFFNTNGIGDKEENKGILILFALEDRMMRIETGDGLEGLLPDGKLGRIRDDYMLPYYREDKFEEGTLNGYKAIFEKIAEEYNYDSDIKAEYRGDIELDDISTTLLAVKLIINIIILGMSFETLKTKLLTFISLETFSGIIAFIISKNTGSELAQIYLVIGTICNLIASFLTINTEGGSYYGGSSGRSSGRSYGGGHSYHGGGGRSSGGGVSGRF